MTRTLDTTEFNDLLGSLLQPTALTELGVLVGCLVLAWALVRLLRGQTAAHGSIWFGERIVDGVLFPVLALALAFGARLLLAGTLKIAVFKLAIPILLSLLVIRLAVRVLQVTFPSAGWVRPIERTVSWIAWLAVVLWITGVLPLLLEAMDEVSWKVGSTKLTLRNLVEGTVTAGLVLVVALWISAAIEKQLLRGTGDDLSMRKIAANLVRALLLFLGLILAMSAVGIDLTALSVLGGAVGVGLGFGLQKIAANYVSGFVILAERALRIGDMVKVADFEGVITDITTRYTVIRAPSGREAIVPNEILVTTAVQTMSLADRNVLLSTVVGVDYATDVAALRQRLIEAIAAVPRVLQEPGPAAQLTGFGADALELSLYFWISDPENGQGNVRSEVNLAILDLLRREGIGIPYPQRVVHLPAQPPVNAFKAPSAESAP